MSETKIVTHNSIGFLPLLTIVFITLKLTGYITWSWFWVLSPILIPTMLIIGLIPLYIYLNHKEQNVK